MKKALKIILLSALSLLAVIVINWLLLISLLLKSCHHSASNKNKPDGYINCAEKFAPEYIENKYGFKPKILSSERGTTVALVPVPRKTNEVFLKLSDGEREFDVRAFVLSEDSGMDDINFSDNYQLEEISGDLGEFIDSKLPGLAAIDIKFNYGSFPDHFTNYYDGENLLDFLSGTSLRFQAYYVDRDFSDASQLDFLEVLDSADIVYNYKFISCRSNHAVEYVRDHLFEHDTEIESFAPYIGEYISGFRNSQTKETPVYKKFNSYMYDAE